MNQRGLAHILLLLVLAALVGVIFLLIKLPQAGNLASPQLPIISQKSSIPSYQDPLGFKFNYPAGYTVTLQSEQDYSKRNQADFRKNFFGYVGYQPPTVVKALQVKSTDSSSAAQFDPTPFELWVFDNPDNMTLNKWFENYWYYPFLWGVFAEPDKSHILPQSVASISGQPTIRATVTYQPNTPSYFYLSDQGKVYLIKTIKRDPQDSVARQILDSLKLP